jgi:hypothetical protein
MCKAQAVVEHNEDDALIIRAADAAELAVENHLQCPLSEYEDASGALPAAIVQGMLLFFVSLYDNRGAFTALNVNTHTSILALLNPYICYDYHRRQS